MRQWNLLWVAVAVAAAAFLAQCGGSSGETEPTWREVKGGSTEDGGGGGGGGSNWQDVTPAPDVPPAVNCAPYGAAGVCDPLPVRPPHLEDGAFGGWAPDRPCAHEWSCAPNVMGVYTYVFFDYDGEFLHLVNDWHLNDEAAIEPTAFNLFRAWTDDGAVAWTIRVYGDQHVEVARNEEPVDDPASLGVVGAAGFGRSPFVPDFDHTIFELRFPAGTGGFGLLEKDPAGPGGTGEDLLTNEPTFFTGTLNDGGGVDVRGEPGPALIALEPPAGGPGDVIVLRGMGFGEEVGGVFFNGSDARILAWSDEVIRAEVPPDVLSGQVRVGARRRWSNALPFGVTCRPDCFLRDCGPDGCGGGCGGCGAGTTCTNGACVCAPDCGDRVCGDDGCGGPCGACGAGEACLQGRCDPTGTPCEPSCAGRFCGGDGCGGICGACPDGWSCQFGTCAQGCAPDCTDRACGPNGCGGSCGTCRGTAAQCVQGACECTPSCLGRECGDDGCGGTCGSCAGGLPCSPVGLCEECVPSCAGRECGTNGCGGSCGACQGGLTCNFQGRCVGCEPRCEGRLCGADGCGGTCGACEGPNEVCQSGQCVCSRQCGGRDCGPDGCGGLCGECGLGDLCSDAGVCVPKAEGQ